MYAGMNFVFVSIILTIYACHSFILIQNVPFKKYIKKRKDF